MPFLFGTNGRMKDLERRIRFIAGSGLPVLIEGPCGTGKEALAELVHELSRNTCPPARAMDPAISASFTGRPVARCF